MSARENFVSVEGNLVSTPELRFTPTGKAVLTATVAQNTRRQVDGVWMDGHTSFFDVVCWEKLAENVATLHKGDRVTVIGSLTQRSWEDNETKATRYKVEIIADMVNVSLRFATVDISKVSFRTDEPSTVAVAKVDAPVMEDLPY